MINHTVGGSGAHGIAVVEDLARWWPWLLLVIGAVALFIIGSGLAFRSPGRRARGGRDGDGSTVADGQKVPGSLRRLSRQRYTIFSNINLVQDGSSIWLDHVVVSRHGIFVVKTDHHDGTVSGEPGDETWIRRSGRHRTPFSNPLPQSEEGVSALAKFLDLPREVFHPIVFFTEGPVLASTMPLNVLNCGVGRHIARHRAVVLPADRRDQVLKVLNLLVSATVDSKSMGASGSGRRNFRPGGGVSGVA